jgi:hypothetical protein
MNLPCFAKLAACRHTILKEGLTAAAGKRRPGMARGTSIARNHAEIPMRMAYSQVIRRYPLDILTMFRS